MIAELFIVGVITLLFIKGFHAVTRSGMLLSFLGAYIKEEEELHNAEYLHNETALAIQDDFFESLNEAREDDQVLELVQKYEEAMRICLAMDNYGGLTSAIIEKKRRWWYKGVSLLSKPYSECETCMGSLWGAIFLGLYFSGALFTLWVMLPIFPILIAGAVQIVNK